MIVFFGFFSASEFFFQGDFALLEFSTYFSRTKGLNIVVLWAFLRLLGFFFCCFIFVLICILNVRDQFSCMVFGFCFSLVFILCVVMRRE